MDFPGWLVDSIKNNRRVIAFMHPENYTERSMDVIKAGLIDVVGNLLQVYAFLDFISVDVIEPGRVIFAKPEEIDLGYPALESLDEIGKESFCRYFSEKYI